MNGRLLSVFLLFWMCKLLSADESKARDLAVEAVVTGEAAPEEERKNGHPTMIDTNTVHIEAPPEAPENTSLEEEQKAVDDFDIEVQDKYKIPGKNIAGEINYSSIKQFSALLNQFFDEGENENGNKNNVGDIPPSCDQLLKSRADLLAKNPNGIIYIQPSNPSQPGAVIFGNPPLSKACSGMKRTREGNQNNWPSEATNGVATMTPNGQKEKMSENFSQGDYGTYPPIWLGGGAVQIHSLRNLKGNASVAGVYSKGCLVVNHNCMQEINSFIGMNTDLKFSIIAASTENDSCTNAVNSPQKGNY